MKTAVDTNVVSTVWSGGVERLTAARLLWEAQMAGGLVICPIVLAEMVANPFVPEEQVRLFLKEMEISIDFEMAESVWLEAGRRFAGYSKRRKHSGGGEPRRLLADFVVGAHALVQADRLLTFDVKRYATDFPELKLV